MSEIKINSTNGQPTVSSLQITKNFGKTHKDILEKIDNMKAEFSALLIDPEKYFIEGRYKTGNNKRTYKYYEITRDGFSLLVMGFTGSKAFLWKLKYIDAFNAMEKELQDREKNKQYRIKCRNFILINGKEFTKEVFQPSNERGDKKMNDNSEIKRHLIDYVYEITTKSKGRNQYICPICGSGNGSNHTGAFTVYPETNSYYCFSCQASGDIFTLYGAVNNISDFKTVKKELENKYSPVQKEKDYTYFFSVAANHLHETDYLTKRGISPDTQRKFNIGYVSDFKYKGGRSTSAVIIPTSDKSFAWRSTTENLKQKRGAAHIFNSSALNQPYCFVVEGEIDAMSIEELGFPCIGLGSTSNIKKIFNYNVSNTVLIIAMDGDTAGKKAETKLINLCNENEVPYIRIPGNFWNGCKDANEFLVKDKQTLSDKLKKLSNRALMFDIDKFKAELQETKANTPDWMNQLKRSSTDNSVKNTLQNLELIFLNDPKYKDKIEFNELSQMRTFCRENWRDVTENRIKLYLEKEYSLTTSIESINQICSIIADDNSFNPIKEYIEGQQWDGIHRIKSIFTDFLGATDSVYTQSVAVVSFVGAVARIYNPGVKFDTCTVLVGKQGTGKSKFLGKIAVNPDWFTDGVTTFDGKDFYESIQGKWIIELGEGTAFQKSIKERSKQAIASQQDFYRKPYGRHPEIRKRQCVFFGTTNNYDFLKDETGDRRYYPIDVNIAKATKNIDKDLTEQYVGQIWAEAYELYKHGQSIYIQDSEVLNLAEQEQRKHFDESPLQADIFNFLDIPITKEWYNATLDSRREHIKRYQNGQPHSGAYKRDRISVKEIACELFGYDINQPIDRKFSLEIARTLTALGWNKTGKKERLNIYNVQWIYTK